ncbi:4Fe-4S dicluster domain-containing protein [Paramaledivibacter caminithermalis]|jgi:Na+-translocating ferredoxin:NAD+ oxidoreductase RnfC subunit|uniref:Na+-translocating ferredoxin:NAD+ oxidoreductase RNF, RnfC subunit n=1 Tax=Paramaledivibacter caminithermalis (strain DSM 15212 / CIP 107654 / DViRD3) TaxID=1121301 RepID=A0A1M6PNB3_PARC5|nr:4Fe-4S dicluster domain-containing protein [Paramaledivibacter caminithermalis]SHK09421.1 Na+-translocating ferredoxin:NAD+ oxidoreductase RNF, RnfC subunit [Paramaledivibacter caminithermalis DSM 15212]
MDLLEKIFDAGIVGAGGAGFPTHIKLNCSVEYLIVNGAECEPLLETDKYLMRTEGHKIIKAMEEVAKKIQAKKLIIGLKAKYKEEIKALKRTIEELNSKVELFLLDNFYPAGDEQILVYEITKRSIPPSGIPLDVGVVVSNVGTLVNIYEAINEKPVIDKYVTVIGEIKKPCILKVPIGTSVDQCIKAVGDTLIDDYAVILGGPMMGNIIYKEETQKEFITKTIGALIIIPREHYIVERKELPIKHIINRAKTSCIQCSMCTDMCPRNLIGHKLRPHRIMRSIGMSEGNENILMEALICCECGVCELYACPMGLSPRRMNIYLKDELRKKGVRYKKEQGITSAKEIREYRKIPVNRLISRLGLSKYKGISIDGPFEVKSHRVHIPLKQCIGKPSNPVVSVGDMVSRGQIIGKVHRGQIGANVHSSIDGKVCEVSDYVVIQSDDNEVIS